MNYHQLGLISGIEIHQQLEGNKLFCACPTEIIDAQPDAIVERVLRAVEGETGEIDIAASHEQKKQKYYRYHLYHKNTCLVEIDEEPPHPVNKTALKTCLIAAKLLDAKVVDEIQFMRKTVIDGSNVSGFQRTALVATDGFIETSFGKVSIPTICLEEDSAKIIEKHTDYAVYNLSRLGIPLIEIATAPDMHSPEQVKEVAEKIGMLLRATNAVKRGLGTIRQDLNISIKGCPRVEIKGAQDLHLIPKIVEYEVQRQQNMLALTEKLQRIPLLKQQAAQNLTQIFTNTQCAFLQKAIKEGKGIYGLKIPCFAGIFGSELMPNHRVGTEISDKTKLLTGAGIVHSDELPKFGITDKEVAVIREKLSCNKDDAFVLSAVKHDHAKIVFEIIIEQINLLRSGVISEVRAATQEATSKYMRPMPGSARMYPETDIPSIPITEQYLKLLSLPETLEAKQTRLETLGLSNDLAELLVKKGDVAFFETCVAHYKNLKPAFIAEVLLPKLLEVKRKYNVDIDKITQPQIKLLLGHLNQGSIVKSSVEEIFLQYAQGKEVNYGKFKGISRAELERAIKEIIASNKGKPVGAIMGLVMKRYQGNVDGKLVSEILHKFI
ncbi:Glu-tRNA(Gln) amidotransferase subunit GatE [Candidatus Woesearchaeota archaeon]|nr:Glu-tRNA(Gln) amidotransferase subunit GatE [Candidatus Woesearchaeota archaeon]